MGSICTLIMYTQRIMGSLIGLMLQLKDFNLTQTLMNFGDYVNRSLSLLDTLDDPPQISSTHNLMANIHSNKQFKFLQEGSNRIVYPRIKSFWSCSHMNQCQHYMLHINLYILIIHFIKLNLNVKEFQESNN